MKCEFCWDLVGTKVDDWSRYRAAPERRRSPCRRDRERPHADRSSDNRNRSRRPHTMLVWRCISAVVWLLAFILACDQQVRFRAPEACWLPPEAVRNMVWYYARAVVWLADPVHRVSASARGALHVGADCGSVPCRVSHRGSGASTLPRAERPRAEPLPSSTTTSGYARRDGRRQARASEGWQE